MARTDIPERSATDLPWLDTEQMVEVDRRMTEDIGIELPQMMENAGRHLARLAVDRYGLGADSRVVALAGGGGNGGGVLVAARRLHGWGVGVTVVLHAPPPSFSGVPAMQVRVLERLGVPIHSPAEGGAPPNAVSDDHADVILDGLIGYSLHGDPRSPIAELIRWANDAAAPVLSMDVPSGVDAAAGTVGRPAVRADATLTLALPKRGLRNGAGRDTAGDLYLADIGVPPAVYAGMSVDVPDGLFRVSEILRIVG